MLDILQLRDKLNATAFKGGSRCVLIGRISDRFPVEQDQESEEDDQSREGTEERDDDEAVVAYLQQLQCELGQHSLMLERGEDDRDALFAVQKLRPRSEPDLSWMAEGLRWVSTIITVSLEMVVPGILGLWLDSALGTRFLSFVGLVIGVPLGLWHLLRILGTHSSREGGRSE